MVHTSISDTFTILFASPWPLNLQIAPQPLGQILQNLDRLSLLVKGFPTIYKNPRISWESAKSRYSVHYFSRLPVSRPNTTKHTALPTIGKGHHLSSEGLGLEGAVGANPGSEMGWQEVPTRLTLQPKGKEKASPWLDTCLLAAQGPMPPWVIWSSLPGVSRRPGGPW